MNWMAEIFHVTPRADWENIGSNGVYQCDSLATEGFIHCCSPVQLAGVLDRYFRGRTGLVALRINPERLTPPLRWESPPGSDEAFPHLYGALNVDAVVEVVALDPMFRNE